MKPGVDIPLTVVSMGMLADIVAPLLLVEDVDLIVAIDLVDAGYLQPWYLPCGQPKGFAEVRRFIMHILTSGSDLALQCANCLLKKTSLDWPNCIRSIRARCAIVEDHFDDRLGRWTLDFQYGKKVRRLVFYQRDYVTQEWPPEAHHISHLLTVGSPFPANAKAQVLMPRLKSRCLPDCIVHASRIVLEDEPEGWLWPVADAKFEWNRGGERIDVWKFSLSAWLAKRELQQSEGHTCAACGKTCDKRCQQCRAVWFCNADCQKTAWPEHKKVCVKPPQ